MFPDEITLNIILGEIYTDAYSYIHFFITLFKTGNIEWNIKYLSSAWQGHRNIEKILDWNK